ncbi:hypothetical protein [Mesorhizobium sp. M0590]|uniref:hypothetical protein n=1 Tax=unclassified Mesorhizobium TaxID=325217 RepID=UPI00333CB101
MDPATIAALVEAAQAYFAKQSDDLWKSDVSDKLDEISEQLNEIIDILYNLRVWIAADTKATIVALVVDVLSGQRGEIEKHAKDIRAGTATREDFRQMTEHGSGLAISLDVMYNWQNYGFTYYPATIGGFLTYFYYLSVTKGGPLYTQEKLNQYTGYLAKALDRSEARSIGHAYASISSAVADDRGFLSQFIGRFKIASLEQPMDFTINKAFPVPRREIAILSITADTEQGILYSKQVYSFAIDDDSAETVARRSELEDIPLFGSFDNEIRKVLPGVPYASGGAIVIDGYSGIPTGDLVLDYKIKPFLEPRRTRYVANHSIQQELQNHVEVLQLALDRAPKTFSEVTQIGLVTSA